ncbi:MAG: DoxX family membrane protein, partial [Bacteroidetes bacterium]
MTLTSMVIGVGIAALIVTLAIYFLKGEIKNWLISFLQNFAGVLFIFSGLVKAVDPLGTAYKMQDYFAEFEATFSGTAFNFLAPMFPWFSQQADIVSVVMIVFEIALGVMLIIGFLRKLT